MSCTYGTPVKSGPSLFSYKHLAPGQTIKRSKNGLPNEFRQPILYFAKKITSLKVPQPLRLQTNAILRLQGL